ncbi:MAG: recombination protein O N-terminal domain-containing protein [Elusimicrobia bacterium]|nr:recombination protein O N-terminal domain-containing protein [Elusimicrobiota bacterium]
MHTNVDAVVLSTQSVSERDKRLTLFTRERGRLFARATGALRPGARLAAATEPAVWARFRLWLPEGAVGGRVTGGAVVDGHPSLRGQWIRLTSALFFCEWTDRLTPLLQASPEKFDLLARALAGLERYETATVRAAFLTQFARLAGYGPMPGLNADRLDEWDFECPLHETNASAVERQVIQFLSPLLTRPLRTLVHGRALDLFFNKNRLGFSQSR